MQKCITREAHSSHSLPFGLRPNNKQCIYLASPIGRGPCLVVRRIGVP